MVLVAQQRFRSRVVTVQGGTAYYSTGVPISGSGTTHNTAAYQITDWRRPKSDQEVYPLDILHYEEELGRLNKDGSQGNHSVFKDFVPAVYTWGNFPHHTSLPGSPSDTLAATMAAARTNPSRPYVDVPVFIAELGDIAQLVRDGFKTILGKSANLNLAYQFGIAPLVGDLVKLVHFVDQFHRRMEEMKRLASEKGLRKTVDIGTYSASGFYEKTLQSSGLLRKGVFFANTKEIVRVHCRWVPTAGFAKLTSGDVEWMVKRILHGLTIDSSSVWEALPLSWLVDYCTSIGNFLKANRNIVPCQLQGAYVMRHTTTVYEFPGLREQDYVFDKSRVTRTTKTRKKVTVAPTAYLPFLSANQVGILSSLTVVTTGRKAGL